MRKRMILAGLLAVSTALPALAQDGPGRRWQQRAGGGEESVRPRSDRGVQANRGDRGEARARPVAAPTPPQAVQQNPAPQIAPQPRGPGQGQPNRGWNGNRTTYSPPQTSDGTRQGWNGRRPTLSPPRVDDTARRGWTGSNAGWRGRDRDGDGVPNFRDRDRDGDGIRNRQEDRDRDGVTNWRDRDRDGDGIRNRRDWDRNNDGRVDQRWDRNRNGVIDQRYDRNRDGVRDQRYWNRDWRSDRRYDWQRYRYSNRSLYRLPRYYAPYGYGYGYRRFGIGVYLDSVFWGSNYQISDPYQYRLPEAYPPYRWVRYYDDALLIDERTGTVVDAIYDFFD